jgi:hypothetical protein
MRKLTLTLVAAVVVLGLSVLTPRAADTLPAQYTDAEFWKLINDLSEPGGTFQFENFVSNEASYQNVLPELTKRVKPGGVYLGVAPEQNFTYIAALQSKVGFVIDIRRQNMIEMLMYKALFEISPNRADFVSKLFSRRRPAGLTTQSSALQIFAAFEGIPTDTALLAETVKAVKDNLIRQHGFKPVGDDEQKLELILNVMMTSGPGVDYTSGSANRLGGPLPNYFTLMVNSDRAGKRWAYLETEERYQYIKTMQQKNLIVPLVADFAGPKTLQALAKYLKDRGATVSVFYISNVEDYLDGKWATYVANLKALPQDASTYLIRAIPRATTLLGRIPDLPLAWVGTSSDDMTNSAQLQEVIDRANAEKAQLKK